MTKDIPAIEGIVITCDDCGNRADIACIYGNFPTAHPQCYRCLNYNNSVEQSIVEHEMTNFGGFYGYPSHQEFPLNTFNWEKQEDGRFEAQL